MGRSLHREFIAAYYFVVAMAERKDTHPVQSSKVSSKWPPWWVIVTAGLALVVIFVVIVYGYLAKPGWVGVSDKKFWDYLELLIVPAALAIGVYLLNRAQERERQATEEARREREREAQAAQKERELDVESQRAKDQALQAYLDQMSQLLLDKDRPLRKTEAGAEERTLARARTKQVLWKLDPHRKRNLLQFLREARLIESKKQIIDLSGADLREAYLRELDLENVDLTGADLKGADLSKAKLTAADLRGSMLGGVVLHGADLSRANLHNAKEWTENQLTSAKHLEGATMPNGQKYDDWLKSKSRGEDE
jgi:hypothetical protein